jgi:hypothetical protein
MRENVYSMDQNKWNFFLEVNYRSDLVPMKPQTGTSLDQSASINILGISMGWHIWPLVALKRWKGNNKLQLRYVRETTRETIAMNFG